MARKQVVEVQCDRCPRVEYRELPVQDKHGGLELTIARGDGLTFAFEDLCTPCQKACAVHVEAIIKKLDQVSPDRQK